MTGKSPLQNDDSCSSTEPSFDMGLCDHGRTSKNEFSGLLKSRRRRLANPALVTISLATGSVKPGAAGLGTLHSWIGRVEQACAELTTAIDLYRTMDMTFWLPQAEAALAQIEG